MRWRRQAAELIKHPLAANAVSLYWIQIANYVLPLVTVPYLTRVLGATGWGLVAFGQSFASYVGILAEYGFVLSATREVTRHREDREKLGEIVAGVLGAKAFLSVAGLAVAALAAWWIPIFRQNPLLFCGAALLAVGQAASMIWFFLGIEQVRMAAFLEVLGKAVGAAAIFLLVHHVGQEWRALAVQGVGALLGAAACLVLVYRRVPVKIPTPKSVREALRMGWTMFLFRGSVTLYTTGNAFILGLFVAPRYVGYYAGAEKISKAFLGLLNPVSQSFFPRLSHLVQHARDRAARLLRVSLGLMGTGSLALGLVVFALAPTLIRLILGPGYTEAVPVLRVLSLLIPLIAVSNVLGIQWMLPLGLDRVFNQIIFAAGILNMALAVVLAPLFAQMGMAWAVVTSETFVTCGLYWSIRRCGLDPILGWRT
ncbi:MAG TPA: flippase [Terriglobales bacterium]|nr:flippase [Terriglobales bacterium]